MRRNRSAVFGQISPQLTGLEHRLAGIFHIQHPTDKCMTSQFSVRQLGNRLTISHSEVVLTAGNRTLARVKLQIELIRRIMGIQGFCLLERICVIGNDNTVNRHNRVLSNELTIRRKPAIKHIASLGSSRHYAHLLAINHRLCDHITARDRRIDLIANASHRNIEAGLIAGNIRNEIFTGRPDRIHTHGHTAIGCVIIGLRIRTNHVSMLISPVRKVITRFRRIGLRQSVIKRIAIDHSHRVKNLGTVISRIIIEIDHGLVAGVIQINHSRLITRGFHHIRTIIRRSKYRIFPVTRQIIARIRKAGDRQRGNFVYMDNLLTVTDTGQRQTIVAIGHSLKGCIRTVGIVHTIIAHALIFRHHDNLIRRIRLDILSMNRDILCPCIPGSRIHHDIIAMEILTILVQIVPPTVENIARPLSHQQTGNTICQVRTTISTVTNLHRRAVAHHAAFRLITVIGQGVKRNRVDIPGVIHTENRTAVGQNLNRSISRHGKAVNGPPAVLLGLQLRQRPVQNRIQSYICDIICVILNIISLPQIIGTTIIGRRRRNTLLIAGIGVMVNRPVHMLRSQLNPMLNIISDMDRLPMRIQVFYTGHRVILGIAENLLTALRLGKPAQELVAGHRHRRKHTVSLGIGLHRLCQQINPIAGTVKNECGGIRRSGIALIGMELNDILCQLDEINHRGICRRIGHHRTGSAPVLNIRCRITHINNGIIILAAVIHVLTLQSTQSHRDLITGDNIKRIAVIQDIVIRIAAVQTGECHDTTGVCDLLLVPTIQTGLLALRCTSLTIQNDRHTLNRLTGTRNRITDSRTIIRNGLITHQCLLHLQTGNVRRHGVHRAIHLERQLIILLCRNPEVQLRSLMCVLTAQELRTDNQRSRSVLKIRRIDIIRTLLQHIIFCTISAGNIDTNDLGRRNTIDLAGFIRCKRNSKIAIVHRHDFRNRQHRIAIRQHAVVNLQLRIIIGVSTVDILAINTRQRRHIRECCIQRKPAEIQTGNAVIIHITNIPRTTVVLPAGLVLLTSNPVNFIRRQLRRNQTIRIMIHLVLTRGIIDLNADTGIAGLTVDIQRSNRMLFSLFCLKKHPSQIDIRRLTIGSTHRSICAGFDKDFILNLNRIAIAVNVQRTAILHVNAVAVSNVIIAENTNAGYFQTTAICNIHCAGRILTIRSIIRDIRIILNQNIGTTVNIQSRTAIVDILNGLQTIRQTGLVNHCTGSLDIQNASFVSRTVLPGQRDIRKRHISAADYGNSCIACSSIIIERRIQRILIALERNAHIAVIQNQRICNVDIALKSNLQVSNLILTGHINGV